ncbi:Hypothetical_protein [Hexamita inflata]|uniref:Hypothetical_protein n=1 Tax=Hexamita inflata TaxID=28002 RepID=A0AA86QFH6_9EUKA|nr:Hypothetical protein HINF_LOCUS39847 [Hexamita inflata]
MAYIVLISIKTHRTKKESAYQIVTFLTLLLRPKLYFLKIIKINKKIIRNRQHKLTETWKQQHDAQAKELQKLANKHKKDFGKLHKFKCPVCNFSFKTLKQ